MRSPPFVLTTTAEKRGKIKMKTLFIKGIEFFNFLTAIGLKGLLTPFDDYRYPTLRVVHPSPGKVKITTENGNSIIMADTDTLRLDLDGSMTVVKGPSHYSNKWMKVFATTFLKKTALKFNTDPIFVPHGCMALAYDSNRSFTEREAVLYHQPGRMIYGYELVILFNEKDQPAEFFVRTEKSVNAFTRFEKFITEHELTQRESGAFDHVRETAQAKFEAQMAEDRQTARRNREFWGLVNQLRVETPKTIEVAGKKFTISNGKINRGTMVGGKRVDPNTLFENGVLHQIVRQVSASAS